MGATTERLTVQQMRDALNSAGVHVPSSHRRDDVQALYDAMVEGKAEQIADAAPLVEQAEQIAAEQPDPAAAEGSPAALVPMVHGERLALLRSTLASDLTDQEFLLFAEVCNRHRLDPFARQVHAVVRGQGDRRRLTVQTGIDGLRVIADRTGNFAGSDEPVFTGEAVTHRCTHPLIAKVTVRKIVQGTVFDTTREARWSEFYPDHDKDSTTGNGNMWRKMPHVMLAKCAEAAALRAAFPADLSGLYVDEEMHQADVPINVHATTRSTSGDEFAERREALAARVSALDDDQRAALHESWGAARKAEPPTPALRHLGTAEQFDRAEALVRAVEQPVVDDTTTIDVASNERTVEDVATDLGGTPVDVCAGCHEPGTEVDPLVASDGQQWHDMCRPFTG